MESSQTCTVNFGTLGNELWSYINVLSYIIFPCCNTMGPHHIYSHSIVYYRKQYIKYVYFAFDEFVFYSSVLC